MAKSEHPFDQFIKEQLDTFEAHKMPDWHYMHQKIQEAEADVEFDEKIKASLKDLKVDSPKIGWEPFISRTNQQVLRRNKIILARAIELSLIALLLWTIDNIGIGNFMPASKSRQGSEIAIKNPLESNSNEVPTVHINKSVENRELSKAATSGVDKDHRSFSYEGDTEKFHHTTKRQTRSIDNTSKASREYKPSQVSGILNTIFENTYSNYQHSESDFKDIITSQNAMADGYDPIDKLHQTSALKVDINELQVPSRIQENLNLPIIISSGIKPARQSKSIALNVHTGLMANVIQSPSYDSLSNTLYNQLRPGFLASVGLGFKTDRIELEPNQSELLGKWSNGYYWLHFKKISAHFLTIPVLIHIDLWQGKNWSVSAKTGLSLSASLKNNFDLDTTISYFPTENKGIFFDINDEKNSLISSKVKNPSNQGILQGGSFGVNSYTSLVAGIRFKQQFKSNLSYYVEFEVNKMLGEVGFGPNNDRIISGTINTGISIRLK
jgi:hypothetical protein